MLRLFLALVLVGVLATAGPADAQQQRPSWWPHPDAKRGDLDWPPPRPATWPAGRPWPPPPETTEDLKFWVELYGERIDPAKDPRLAKNGNAGNAQFLLNFRSAHAFDEKAVGCSLNSVLKNDASTVNSCQPYPIAKMRAHCAKALDVQAAKRECQAVCTNNKEYGQTSAVRACTSSYLYQPPIETHWNCSKNEWSWEDQELAASLAFCQAHYICGCFSF